MPIILFHTNLGPRYFVYELKRPKQPSNEGHSNQGLMGCEHVVYRFPWLRAVVIVLLSSVAYLWMIQQGVPCK